MTRVKGSEANRKGIAVKFTDKLNKRPLIQSTLDRPVRSVHCPGDKR